MSFLVSTKASSYLPFTPLSVPSCRRRGSVHVCRMGRSDSEGSWWGRNGGAEWGSPAPAWHPVCYSTILVGVASDVTEDESNSALRDRRTWGMPSIE